MNPYVANPEWGGLIIVYLFLGGVAAGSYAVASMARLFGNDNDRGCARPAEYIAFPLICICGLVLVVDLNKPFRFWHMMFSSQTLLPMLKWWSPMSIGSWVLSLFAVMSGISLLNVLIDDLWIRDLRFQPVCRFHEGRWAKPFAAVGVFVSLFLGSYTGVLLTVTNQPCWSDTPWLGSLFLASSITTGLAATMLGNRWVFKKYSKRGMRRLERADRWAIGVELALICLFMGSFESEQFHLIFDNDPGILIPWVVVPVGIVCPLMLTARHRLKGMAALAAVLVLVGGYFLRYAVVSIPPPLLHTHQGPG